MYPDLAKTWVCPEFYAPLELKILQRLVHGYTYVHVICLEPDVFLTCSFFYFFITQLDFDLFFNKKNSARPIYTQIKTTFTAHNTYWAVVGMF